MSNWSLEQLKPFGLIATSLEQDGDLRSIPIPTLEKWVDDHRVIILRRFASLAGVLNAGFETMSSFVTYLIGFLILIGGLGFAAYLLNIPTMWIAVGVIVLLGIGILMATGRTKMKDPPST